MWAGIFSSDTLGLSGCNQRALFKMWGATKLQGYEYFAVAPCSYCGLVTPSPIALRSDAATGMVSRINVTVVGTFPPGSHPPIVYPAALLTGAADAEDRAFFEALSSEHGDAAFAAQGFAILN